MAPRSLSDLTLSFGLVSIPVKLYSATTSSKDISFHLLHRTCGSRLKQQYVCIKEEVVVPRDQMMKGYEFADEQYVSFTPDELKAIEEKGARSVDIVSFIPETVIDPVFYDRCYYLAPDKRGGRPYSLLLESMKKTGRVALARWANRGKSYTVVVRVAAEGALVLQQLLYGDEVRSVKDLGIEPTEVKPSELQLAVQLIESISREDFDPNEFKDEVKMRLESAIDKKVAGEQITVSPDPVPDAGAQVIDLVEILKSSLQRPNKAGKGTDAAPASKPVVARKKAMRATPVAQKRTRSQKSA